MVSVPGYAPNRRHRRQKSHKLHPSRLPQHVRHPGDPRKSAHFRPPPPVIRERDHHTAVRECAPMAATWTVQGRVALTRVHPCRTRLRPSWSTPTPHPDPMEQAPRGSELRPVRLRSPSAYIVTGANTTRPRLQESPCRPSMPSHSDTIPTSRRAPLAPRMSFLKEQNAPRSLAGS